jgi:hypothetical protein
MRTLTRVGKVVALLGLAGVLTLAFTATAGAATPNTFRFPINETFVDDGVSAVCGFTVTARLVGTATIEVMLDQSGNATRVQIHVNGTGTFSGNGKVIVQDENDNIFLDLVQGTTTDVGIPIRVYNPNGGLIYLDVGRLVFDANGDLTFEAGPHPSLHGATGCPFAALTP